MKRLRWGILGTGIIAHRFAKALAVSETGILEAAASRELEKAEGLVKEFGLGTAYGSYEELLADPAVEAVYIAVPHPMHAEWVVRAAEAGKHILCEKPATMNLSEAETALAAVRKHRVFFMEAFMYRCHPQTAILIDLIRSGKIGRIRLIQCVFAFNMVYDAQSRIFSNRLGGGGILDVGCYCASMARLIAGAAQGGGIAEPVEIKAVGSLDEREKTDLWASALLLFEGGVVAELTAGVQMKGENQVKIYGSEGCITVTSPWFAGDKGAKIIVQKGMDLREISTESSDDLYSYEIDLVAFHREKGEAPYPAMTPADTLGNMWVLDAWRRQVGVVYASDAKA